MALLSACCHFKLQQPWFSELRIFSTFLCLRIYIASKCPVVSREGEAPRHTEILVFGVSLIKLAMAMARRQFYFSTYTNLNKTQIKLFAVYMKTANLMQNFNVLKRSL